MTAHASISTRVLSCAFTASSAHFLTVHLQPTIHLSVSLTDHQLLSGWQERKIRYVGCDSLVVMGVIRPAPPLREASRAGQGSRV